MFKKICIREPHVRNSHERGRVRLTRLSHFVFAFAHAEQAIRLPVSIVDVIGLRLLEKISNFSSICATHAAMLCARSEGRRSSRWTQIRRRLSRNLPLPSNPRRMGCFLLYDIHRSLKSFLLTRNCCGHFYIRSKSAVRMRNSLELC